MSDRIIVMHKGVIQQIDQPMRIYEEPANATVADFIGLVNFMDGEMGNGSIELKKIGCSLPAQADFIGPAFAAVRPEHISMSKKAGGLRGKLQNKIYLGDSTDFRVAMGDMILRVVDRGASFSEYDEGEEISLEFGHVMVFPK